MGHKVASLAPAGNPNGNVPVFMGHGDADPLVRYAWGERTAEALRGMGRKVDFRTYKYVDLFFSFLGWLLRACGGGDRSIVVWY